METLQNLILFLTPHQLKIRHVIECSHPLLNTGLYLKVMTAAG